MRFCSFVVLGRKGFSYSPMLFVPEFDVSALIVIEKHAMLDNYAVDRQERPDIQVVNRGRVNAVNNA